MQRHSITPRKDWQNQIERLGFDYHSPDGTKYWDESACYSFTASEIDGIEDVTNALEAMCLEAVEYIISNKLYARMKIPPIAIPYIEQSWRGGERNIYGRFDLAYDGEQAPKLLEYNADTPTSLLEASVIQWQWLESVYPKKDQFNSIHERLITAWQNIGIEGKIHFASVEHHLEDERTTVYMQDVANQAGLDTEFMYINQVCTDDINFYDGEQLNIRNLFKLYPWEWLWSEDFAPYIAGSNTKFIEPAWKMLLSNKAILPILWERFEGHPNLLPAYFEIPTSGDYVKKPIYGREGNNVEMVVDGKNLARTAGSYGTEGFIYQEYFKIPEFEGNTPIIGSWVVASQSAGIGIREDTSKITGDTARFIPHYFE